MTPEWDRGWVPERDRRVGIVVACDPVVGLGEVEVGPGGETRAGAQSASEERPGTPSPSEKHRPDPARYQFHCTQIADGSRLVEVGTAVTFGLLPGRRGRWEAAGLRPMTAGDE